MLGAVNGFTELPTELPTTNMVQYKTRQHDETQDCKAKPAFLLLFTILI